MIYMVDHVFADTALEAAWHEWYSEYLGKLLSVPGIHSAQRFKALGQSVARYLAMYSIESAEVYESPAYKGMGGGGSQSARFHCAYTLWTRNLFDGAERAPEIRSGQRLLIIDSPAPRLQLALSVEPLWLRAVGLHRTTPYRALAVLDMGAQDQTAQPPGGFIYEPLMAMRRAAGA